MAGAEAYALELRGISKRFGVVQALDGVDLVLRRGEVHALVGENGAGKSTLIQITAGVYQPDEGHIRLDGRDARFSTPAEAEAAGISVVYQELSLVPDLDVAENIYLHREPRRGRVFLDGRQLYHRCAELMEGLGLEIDPRAQVSSLSVAQRQLVEIAKALSRDADVVDLRRADRFARVSRGGAPLRHHQPPAGQRKSHRSTSRTGSTRSSRSATW